jgi:Rrf2 family protein
MRVTARVDYAVRAARELGLAHPGTLTAEAIADRQALPLAFTKQILARMRRAGIVAAQRGGEGGYRLGAPPDEVSVADIVRAVEGPLADVRGEPPEDLDYPGDGEVLRRLWIATRASLRSVLEHVTVADLAGGELPDPVDGLTTQSGAWHRR